MCITNNNTVFPSFQYQSDFHRISLCCDFNNVLGYVVVSYCETDLHRMVNFNVWFPVGGLFREKGCGLVEDGESLEVGCEFTEARPSLTCILSLCFHFSDPHVKS